MKNISQRYFLLAQALVTCSALWPSTAGAQVMFGPPAQGVPVLSSAMLILLSLLLAFVAFVSLKRRQNGVLPVIAGALALASLLSAGGGVSLLHKAYAISYSNWTIQGPSDYTQPITPGINNAYLNDTGGLLQVRNVYVPTSNCPSATALGGPDGCAPGFIFAQGDMCHVNCTAVFSDARLKTDILLIGTTDTGLPWYQFRYRNGAKVYQGVMAQDVLMHTPAAVHLMPNGYLAVDYAMLGLTMQVVN